jgi:hypothetical protein
MLVTIEQWGIFAQIVGGASAALTGLLFVAVSLNLPRIAASPLLREAAAKTLIVLLTPLLVTILMAIPGQTTRLLGLEVVATGLLTGALSLIVREEPGSEDERARARLYQVVAPNLVTTVLLLAAGLSLLAGWGGGLYWVVPAVLAAFLFGVTNAWLLMVRLAHEQGGTSSHSD